MNTSELKELAAVLNGIADGKPWQIANTEPPDWIDAPPNGCPTSVLTNGCKIRLKPWELGRPIPFTLTPEQIADGWVLWSGGECPVEPESRPTVMFGELCGEDKPARGWVWSTVIAYRPDPYGKFRQALADGKTIQCKIQCKCSGNYFVDIENPAFDLSPDRYRIKEPQWLPLGPEDVPPGSAFRAPNFYKGIVYNALSVVETGVIFAEWTPSCSPSLWSFGTLMKSGWKINRSISAGKWDPNAWEPCRKLETETELKQ